MGSRGPVKKPNLSVFKGAADQRARRRFDPAREPACLPPEPDWHALLHSPSQERDAHEEWQSTVVELFRQGLLSRLDAAVAIDYCLCHARVLDCERRLSRNYTTKGANGIVKNPVAQLLSTWRGQLQKHRDALGLSPLARRRMSLEQEAPPDDDSDLDEEPEV